MILVDSNIPIYLIGAPHPHKIDAQRLVERAIRARQGLVSDAEVLQEILHRYVAIDRRDAIQPAFDVLLDVVEEIFPVTHAAAERAKQIVLSYPHLPAREALHVAIMEQNRISQILSFDAGFDSLPGVTRLS